MSLIRKIGDNKNSLSNSSQMEVGEDPSSPSGGYHQHGGHLTTTNHDNTEERQREDLDTRLRRMMREDELSFLKEFSKDDIIKKSKSSLLDVLNNKKSDVNSKRKFSTGSKTREISLTFEGKTRFKNDLAFGCKNKSLTRKTVSTKILKTVQKVAREEVKKAVMLHLIDDILSGQTT